MPRGRRIKFADIRFVSLCPQGKTMLRTLYKADDKDPNKGTVTIVPLVKAPDDFMEKGQLTAAVWVPNRADVEGDWAGPEAIEGMVHSFAKNGLKVDLIHNEKALTRDQVYVAENFVIQPGDSRFAGLKDDAGNPVDAAGGWGAIFQVDSPELRKAYKEGHWAGVSLSGPAVVTAEDPPKSDRRLAMEKALTPGEVKMTPEELAAALAKSNESLVASLVKALAPAPAETPKVEAKAAPAVPAEGLDTSDPVAVKAHIAKLEAARLDTSDPVAMQKHLEKLEKAAGSAPAAAGPGEESEELRKARADTAAAQERVRRLEGKSRQSAAEHADLTKGGDPEKGSAAWIEKCKKTGSSIAAHINGTQPKA